MHPAATWRLFDGVHLGVLAWLRRWTDDDRAQALAARAMASYLHNGMRGQATTYGPYREIYECAEYYLRLDNRSGGRDVPFGVWRTIPLPSSDLLCDITRLYCTCHQLAELGQVSIPEQAAICSVVRRGRHDAAGTWAPQAGDAHIPQALAALERAVKSLEQHDCAGTSDCVEFTELWHAEDIRAERWLARFAPESLGSSYGFS